MELGATIQYDIKKAPKTGDWRSMAPKVDMDKCTGCETCVPFCPEADISMTSSDKNRMGKVAEIDYEFCKGCGVCAAVCPAKAILMEKV